MTNFYTEKSASAVPITPITATQLRAYLESQDPSTRRCIQNNSFIAKSAQSCLLFNAQGEITRVLLGVNDANDFWAFGALPKLLPPGVYQIDNVAQFFNAAQLELAQLGWGLGGYQFNAYVMREELTGRELAVESTRVKALQTLLDSIFLARDLINTPAADMGPEQLAFAAKQVATESGAEFRVIVGEDLLKQNYPTIYAVGKGSVQAPRLIELTWGRSDAPKVTLIGKGVCFDSGGLDIKPSNGMRDMKKDMGGAAHVLALARLVMQHALPIRLRVLIPAVINAVDGKSYYPGDIIKTRSGLTVEIENTDAEGRLILCDALAEAVSEQPECLIDFATLTGAARVALGPDLPALFTSDEQLAQALLQASQHVLDPVWRLPLHKPYRDYFKSDIADMLNASKIPYAGAITAALYLQSFVPDNLSWAHFDICGSNLENRPGRPQGGEVTGLRTVFQFLQQKYPV